ncbi:hypothetical protein ACFSQT_07485 [Mesorhizobium calcicola]|uniref:Uncharacterized protein n=1 Tax=Mesorhizobium calcicola TaxID=1300310 RepID=A0ABW4WA55_9HYPH
MDVARRIDVFQFGFSSRQLFSGSFRGTVRPIAQIEFAAIGASSATVEASSVVIPPDDPPHHPYLGKPPDAYADPLSCREALGLGGDELFGAALQAKHRTVEAVGIHVAEQPDQVTRLVPPFEVAVTAADKDKLPDLVGIAELPRAAAAASSIGIRHGQK